MELIKDKTQKPISLKVVDSNTINVGYEIKMPLLGTKLLNLNFVVDTLADTDLYFHCTTEIRFADFVVNALLSCFNDPDVLKKLDESGMVLHLHRINKLGMVLDKIEIGDVSFNGESIVITFIPKV